MSITDEPKGSQVDQRPPKVLPAVQREKELNEVREDAKQGCRRELVGCLGTIALGVIVLAACSGIAYKAYESIQQFLNR